MRILLLIFTLVFAGNAYAAGDVFHHQAGYTCIANTANTSVGLTCEDIASTAAPYLMERVYGSRAKPIILFIVNSMRRKRGEDSGGYLISVTISFHDQGKYPYDMGVVPNRFASYQRFVSGEDDVRKKRQNILNAIIKVSKIMQ